MKERVFISENKTGILGGGLSGLTVGYLIKQYSGSFEVLEKEETCGGLMRTLRQDDFEFDQAGSHVIFSRNEEAINFILSLLKNNKIKKRRNTKVLYNNRYVKYPFENGLSDLSIEENFECLNLFVQNLVEKAKVAQLKKQSNLKEWFIQTFGLGISQKYLIPYNQKIWKFPVEEMSTDWVDRIPDPPVEDVIKSSLGIKTEGYNHQLHFFYPKTGGIESIIEALEKQLSGNVTKDYEIKRIRIEGNLWVISNGKKEKSFGKIVSTIPIQELVAVIDAPQDVIAAAKGLKYNSLITVMIGLNKNKVNNLSWLYIPDKKILTHRVSFPSNYSPYVTPSKKSSVLAEITCCLGDSLWNMNDESLIERTIDDLYQLGLINKKEVCFSIVRRTKYAYVISDLDYKRNINIIKKYFDEKGIPLVGRFAEFKYLNMDACVESAMNYVNSYWSLK